MRKAALPVCLAIVSIALPAGVAANPDSGTTNGRAGASIVQPLRAVPLEVLSFGALSVGVSGDGEVSVSATSSATYSGSAAPACGAASDCAPHAARFAVSGQGNRAYRVQLPSRVSARGARTGQLLDVSRLSVRSDNRQAADGRGLLDTDGHDEFSVGGVLSVPAATRPDTFRAELAVSVSYD